MFADDTAINTQNKRFSVVISNLQHYISLLELWLNDWKIKVNASKSACLMFTRRPRLPDGLTPVQIFGQPVPWVHVAKYLRLFLDAKLTFAHHIEQTHKKAQAVHAVLKRLISRRSKLAIRHKALNRRLISGVWTVNSPQSHIVRVYDAGHGKSGVFHSAEWHDGDWSSDGIREAWLWFFIWVESF
ncbi:hypothetical protein TNCV_1417391 [Trichonephila clavipes]|nr:hypothetical protein TNCV_1417391 [Trichonephila clavipes]